MISRARPVGGYAGFKSPPRAWSRKGQKEAPMSKYVTYAVALGLDGKWRVIATDTLGKRVAATGGYDFKNTEADAAATAEEFRRLAAAEGVR